MEVGGIEDHIHALVMHSPTLAPSQITQFLKGDSSKWMHQEFPVLRDLAWQDGYGLLTGSKPNLPVLLHSESARTSPPENLPGGVSGISAEARDCPRRRLLCGGSNRRWNATE